MSQYDLFVGNSNGPSHIAVASGPCSLQLHGHTEAAAWCPNSKKHQSIQAKEFFSGRKDCTLDSILLDDVLNKLSVFPSVLKSNTSIHVHGAMTNGSAWKLVDQKANVLQEGVIDSSSQLQIESLPRGIYYLLINQETFKLLSQ